jgi:microcystin degradation protein MlrC
MRVGIVAFLQESNTFIARATTLEHFAEDLLLEGETIRERLAAAHHEVGGFFAGLDAAHVDAVPIFAARAVPFGTIAAPTFDALLRRLEKAVRAAGPLDGVLAAAHGATVSQQCPDVDGHWLARLRELVGPNVPIVATIDPHANLSRRMVDAVEALVAYRTNPHIDQRQRGEEAVGLLLGLLRGELRPTQAASFPPMAINIECQQTTEPPCRSWYALAEEIRRRPGVLSVSPVLGFPYADVPEMGASTLVVTDGDAALARQYADELAAHLWRRREEFRGQLIGMEEAINRLDELPAPVCLLDMGDNVGAGSPADGTALARQLHARGVADSLVCLNDPEVARRAARTGIGRTARFRIGGKTDNLHGDPLEVQATVLGLYDGKFCESRPRHGGFAAFDQGASAVLRTPGGMTILVTSRRTPPWSLAQLTSCGLKPESFRAIVAKGVNAPLAAYQQVCRSFVRVNTPGVTSADMTFFTYHRRRRPMFPFEAEAAYG